MIRDRNLKRKKHCIFSLCFHVIFVTKFRKHCLSPQILLNIIQTLPKIAREINIEVTEINGESDHIHFLLEITPLDRLSSVIGILKAKLTKHLYSLFSFPYWGRCRRTLWSSGYYVASTGGVSIETLKKYIKDQGSDAA